MGIGLLVLLNELQIPFYLYYPHVTHTVFISDPYDLYFFLASSVCVPSTLVLLKSKLASPGLIGILAIYIVALGLTILGQSFGAMILYTAVILCAVLNVSKTDQRGLAVNEVLAPALSIFILIESSSLYYWISAAFSPRGQTGLSI